MSKSILIVALFAFLFAGCDSGANDTEGAEVRLTMQAEYAPTAAKQAAIVIQEAKLLVDQIKFHSDDADSLDFRAGSVIVNLNLNNEPVVVSVGFIPAGRYEHVSFKIHKPEDNEAVSDPDFKEGTSGNERFSVVVKGTYDGEPFVYKSSKTAQQRIDFSPDLVVSSPDTSLEVALTVDINSWFVGDEGEELSPLNESDSNDIDDAIRRSIRRRN
ncbi:MAG: hypothetical protein SH809_03845 [Rhodothermales bacterium]|nr:hypothetical protein [Rhodothermales bacterium]